MAKKENYYSVIIVSGAKTSNKEFEVSGRLVRRSLVAIILMLVFSGIAIFDYLTTSFDSEKMKRLEKDVQKKERLIADLNKKVGSLSMSVKRMEIYTERILVASGLKSPLALREVGSGGPVSMEGSALQPQVSRNINPSVSAEGVVERARQLSKKSKDIENTLKYVRSVIDKQKLRLASTPSLWPTRGYLTDPFGWRRHPLTGKRDFHQGVDIGTQLGNKIIAPANGVVLCSEKRAYYGNLVIIDHGYGYTTRYGHLASFNVREGQRVQRGDVVGFVGSTGSSTAPHLHYEIRFSGKPQNPLDFMID